MIIRTPAGLSRRRSLRSLGIVMSPNQNLAADVIADKIRF